jgi:hypothetical protein
MAYIHAGYHPFGVDPEMELPRDFLSINNHKTSELGKTMPINHFSCTFIPLGCSLGGPWFLTLQPELDHPEVYLDAVA